jgi:hypothetical protein
MLAAACRKALRHRDRWRAGDMLRQQPDLNSQQAVRFDSLSKAVAATAADLLFFYRVWRP